MEEIKYLLENQFILKEEKRDLFYRIKDNYKEIKPFIVDKLGYDCIMRGDFIRLEKRPGKAESWMGIKAFENKEAYVFFMLLLIFLEDKNKEDQFLLSHITDYIEGHPVEEKVDWTQYKTRRMLIKVLQVALEYKLLKVTDGDEDGFIQDVNKEVLFESTGLSRYFVRDFQMDLQQVKSYKGLEIEREDLLDQERGSMRKNRVYRKLLLSPIVYQEEGQDEDYTYIKMYHHIIEEDFRKYLGWTFQLYRNGAMVIPDEKDRVTYTFPNTSTLSDMILQFNGIIRHYIEEGIWRRSTEDTIKLTQAMYQEAVEVLIRQKSEGWSKAYREASKERIAYDLLEEMQRFKMITVKDGEIVILPLAGKIMGDYPKDFLGGQIRE